MSHYLVTGALGCIGAWVTKQLIDEAEQVTMLDLGGDRRRLSDIAGPAAETVPLLRCDVTDAQMVTEAFARIRPTHVIHLAGLQVPACRENPALGAAVNVGGTINVLDAVHRTASVTAPLIHASSVAVFDAGSVAAPALDPVGPAQTNYGVFKRAAEDLARIYERDGRAVASIGIRPYVVYGPGRDQGLTSAPTLAMQAASEGRAFHLPYGGTSQMQYAPDVAATVLALSRTVHDAASVVNLDGPAVAMTEIVEVIEQVVPESAGSITFDDTPLPFPPCLDPSGLLELLPARTASPLAEGVRETIDFFRSRRNGTVR